MEHEVDLGMTLYDMNKSIMQNEKKLSPSAIRNKMVEVARYFSDGEYFMLLCHDLRDYTIFKVETNDCGVTAANELRECMNNRGEILSIEFESTGAYEIWIRNAEGVFAYYLFPYDSAVIIC